MARPPLPLGTHGNTKVVPPGDGFVARCRCRCLDMEGVTRQVERAHGVAMIGCNIANRLAGIR